MFAVDSVHIIAGVRLGCLHSRKAVLNVSAILLSVIILSSAFCPARECSFYNTAKDCSGVFFKKMKKMQ